eukprot:364787-Chlamydomonas_euryale.AAC.17
MDLHTYTHTHTHHTRTHRLHAGCGRHCLCRMRAGDRLPRVVAWSPVGSLRCGMPGVMGAAS